MNSSIASSPAFFAIIFGSKRLLASLNELSTTASLTTGFDFVICLNQRREPKVSVAYSIAPEANPDASFWLSDKSSLSSSSEYLPPAALEAININGALVLKAADVTIPLPKRPALAGTVAVPPLNIEIATNVASCAEFLTEPIIAFETASPMLPSLIEDTQSVSSSQAPFLKSSCPVACQASPVLSNILSTSR